MNFQLIKSFLISIIHENKLYVSNLGDAKARLFIQDKNNLFSSVKLMHRHNAAKRREQKRIKKL